MKYIDKKVIFLLLIIINLCIGCSSSSKKNKIMKKNKHKVYLLSPEERKKKEAIRRYRIMRLNGIKTKVKRKKRRKKINVKIYNGRILTEEEKKSLNLAIKQNIDYYCIKHEGNGKFESKTECQNHAQNKLNDCKLRLLGGFNHKLLKCLKKELYLR